MKKLTYLILISLFLIACEKESSRDQLLTIPDTVVIGHTEEIMYYIYNKHQNTTIITLNFRYYDNKELDMKIINSRYFFTIDESKPMVVKLIGFKDSAKYIPVIVESEYIQVDSIQEMKDFYQVKLLKDTVDVDFMIDCGQGKIKLLHYPIEGDTTKVLYDSVDTYRVGYGKFVRLKK